MPPMVPESGSEFLVGQSPQDAEVDEVFGPGTVERIGVGIEHIVNFAGLLKLVEKNREKVAIWLEVEQCTSTRFRPSPA